MIGFFVIACVGLVGALIFVLARRARRHDLTRGARPAERLTMLTGPGLTGPGLTGPGSTGVINAGAPGPSTKTMVDVTPRGTSIKV